MITLITLLIWFAFGFLSICLSAEIDRIRGANDEDAGNFVHLIFGPIIFLAAISDYLYLAIRRRK